MYVLCCVLENLQGRQLGHFELQVQKIYSVYSKGKVIYVAH